MTWTPEDIPDQQGRVAVVTGANGGLGLATARQLARKGAHVVMAARDQDKAAAARDSILGAAPGAAVEIRALDLASLDWVRKCAEGIVADHDHVDVLVNNAGVMGIPARTTADGFEMQLGVNHLGHFVFTARLLPALLAAPAGRVISITSFARHTVLSVGPGDLRLQGAYGPWRAYGASKLANLHFAIELARRLRVAGVDVASLAAHPGLSNTDLQARSVRQTDGGISQRFWHFLARWIGMPAERGAWPQLRAATDPRATSGQLFTPRWVTFGPPVRRPLLSRSLLGGAARRLWDASERAAGEPFDVAAVAATPDRRAGRR